MPLHLLLKTEAEYRQARAMLQGYSHPSVKLVRDQLDDVLSALREEIGNRCERAEMATM